MDGFPYTIDCMNGEGGEGVGGGERRGKGRKEGDCCPSHEETRRNS